jgi:hypothetical protein
MDQNAINDWHGLFDRKRTIVLEMVLDDGSTDNLTVDLFCTQHSTDTVMNVTVALEVTVNATSRT